MSTGVVDGVGQPSRGDTHITRCKKQNHPSHPLENIPRREKNVQ